MVRRLLQMFFTLFILITILFFLFRVLPGDPLTMYVDAALPQEVQDIVKHQFGLDKPLGEQYLLYIRNLLHGEFGQSFHFRRPVVEIIGEKFWSTVLLMGASLVLTILLGVVGGALLAWYRGSRFEIAGIGLTILLRSAPVFWTGMLAVGLFALKWKVFPLGGMNTPGQYFATPWQKFFSLDFLYHLILPALIAAANNVATPLLIMRSSMVEILGEDFIEMARAKGIREMRILFKHAMRNALLPVVTVLALMIGFAIGGQVLVETVFRWPGMGREIVVAIQRNDYPVAQAAFFFMGVLVISLNFISDILYGYLDPRVTYD